MNKLPKYTSEEIDRMIEAARTEAMQPTQIIDYAINQYYETTRSLATKFLGSVDPTITNVDKSFFKLSAIVQGLSLNLRIIIEGIDDPMTKRMFARQIDEFLGTFIRDTLRK